MNKILSLLGFLLFTSTVFCQISVTVSGTVTDTDGVGVGDITIEIAVDSTNNNFVYYNTVLTNADGSYSDTFEVPDEMTQGQVYAWMQDCNNSYQSGEGFWSPGSQPVIDFVYCNTSCYVTIEEVQNGSWLQANAFGTAPFSYIWSTGQTTASIEIAGAGDYCLSVIDATNCVSAACYTIDDGCNESVYVYQDGNQLTAAANIGDIQSYSWNTGEHTQSITVQQEGEYCVSIAYGENCLASSCIYFYTDTVNVDSCYVFIEEVQNGSWLQATAYGVAPYSYAWSTGQSSAAIEITVDTMYCVTATDAVGCSSVSCYTIDDGCNESVYIYQNDTYLFAAANIAEPVSYYWNTGETTEGITVIEEGEYCVTVSYGANCLASDCMYFYADTTNYDSCHVLIHPVQNGSWLSASGSGMPPFAYAWNTGENTAAIEIAGDTLYCVTITDAMGCVAVDCYEIWTPGFEIYGYLTADSNDSLLLEGVVNLYAIDDNQVSLVATTTAINYYDFSDVAEGNYIVQAIVDGYLPTYHYSSLWWDEADIVTTQPNSSYVNIQLIPLQELVAGPGSITGTVTEPDGIVGHGNSGRDFIPIQGAEIILFDSNNAPIAYMFTDDEGAYSFEGLAYGTYTVYIELMGYEQVFYTITIGANNEAVENINFVVQENAITTATRSLILADNLLSLYPNPVKNELNINLYMELKGNANIQLFNITGQLISSDSFAQYEQQKSMNVASLNAGLYILKVTTDEGIIVKQFVKE